MVRVYCCDEEVREPKDGTRQEERHRTRDPQTHDVLTYHLRKRK